MTDQPKGFSADLLTFDQRADRYMKFIRSVETRRFVTGLYDLDKVIRGVAPGEVMTIIAYSGTYKSAYLQHLLNQFGARTKTYQLFFSQEMPAETVFEREVQMGCRVHGSEVEKHYKDVTESTAWMHEQAEKKGSKYVLVCEKSRLTLDKMAKYCEVARAKWGEVGCIGIDYLGLMSGDGKSIFERMADLSYGIKDMAKQLMVPIILLGQVNRGYAASKGVEIEMDAAKGGGDIEAGADFMLGLFMHEDDLILKVLKNRKGRKNIHFKLGLDPDTFSFAGCEPWEPPKQTKRSRETF